MTFQKIHGFRRPQSHMSGGNRRRPVPLVEVRPALVLALALGSMLSAPPAGAAVSFQVQGIFQIGPAHIGVAFTDSVNATQAVQLSNYAIAPQGGAPAVQLQSAALQENHRTVFLTATAALPASATYTLTVTGVTSKSGAPLETGGATSFTTVAETVTGIADVHANIGSLVGQSVTVIGQVFIRASSSGSTPSGYIQDATGRGINLFGSPLQPAADTLGTVTKVTGTVALFFTTVELTPYTATAIASRMPPLAPRVLTVQQASSAQWEGTYIRTTATLTAPPAASGANNYNYTAAEQGTPFIFRVRNATGIDPGGFTTNDVVTGAGAGAVFQTTYQVIVGNAEDFGLAGGAGDVTPPTLVSASGQSGGTSVTVTFSEPLGTGAATASNYSLYPTATPGSPIAVTGASASGATVTLTLASGLQASTPYTVAVSNVEDVAGNAIAPASTVAFTPTSGSAFQVTGVFQFGADFVGVGFSQRVNAAEAVQAGNYAFTPSLSVAQVTIQENGQTALLRTAAPLPASTSYSVSVSGIRSATGATLASSGPFSFQTASETVVDIATIQSDVASWTGRSVTVIGQTYIPVGSRGGTPSGYIQDGSGHGINVFGGSIQAPVNQLGTVAKVTGTVELFFTTVEITGYTAAQVVAGQPNLAPRVLSVADANSSQWEGTYIETTAELTDIQASGASNYNYFATDGGSNITFRVGNGLGISPGDFAVGQVVTGRGAGGSFQTTFQINVGNRADFFKVTAGPDTTRPTLVSASGEALTSALTVSFSEPVGSAEATRASNYRVYPAAAPNQPIAVTSAVLQAGARNVTLALASALQAGVTYAVEVANVADLAGNVILPGSVVTFSPAPPRPTGATLRAVGGGPFPPVTLVRNLTRQGEVFRFEIAGAQDSRAVCRIFDLKGRLVKVLFDARLTGTPTRALSWDARDESFEFVPAGLYICHLETTDLAGETHVDRAPLVVAVRLD